MEHRPETSIYAPLTAERLDALLSDRASVRYPVRLVFEFGEMALHQFAQPDLDWRNRDNEGRVLYIRPALRDHPALLPLAVSYMLPLINYGDIVTDEDTIGNSAALRMLPVLKHGLAKLRACLGKLHDRLSRPCACAGLQNSRQGR